MTVLAPPAAVARSRPQRLLASFALLAAMIAAMLVGPAVVAPSHTSSASAAVYSSCTISRCADARTARSGWASRSFPTARGWVSWSGGLSNYAGGRHMNYEGQLPDERHLLRVRRLPPPPGCRPRRVPDRGQQGHRGDLVHPEPLRRLLPALNQ